MRTLACYFVIIFVIISMICSLPGTDIALAQLENKDLPNRGGIKLGDIILHGAFKTSEELETNIFLAEHGEKFDAITVLNPSAGVEIPFRDNKLSIDYDAGIFLYGTYHTENHIDHRARALAEVNFTDYKIKVNDIYRDFTDRAIDENSRRIERKINNLRAGLSAQFDQLGFDVGYTNFIEVYGQKDDIIFQSITYEDRDRMSHVVDGTVSYRVFPKTSLFMEGDLGLVHYYNSSLPPDSYFIETVVGIKGRPTNKILANIKGGFRYQHYDKSDVISDKPFMGPVISGGLEFLATKDDTLNLGLERRIFESTYQNINYYNINLASLKYTHKFNKKISVSPFGYYQLNLYPTATVESGVTDKRYDNIFGGGCTLRYDIRKWASAEAKYEYTQRDSRFSIYDYIDNRIIFSGTVGF